MTAQQKRSNANQALALRDWLKSQLDEVFRQSAAEYNLLGSRYDSVPDAELGAINRWHEGSLEAVVKGYSLAAKINPEQAEALVWEIVDEFFLWSKEDRTKPDKFLAWLKHLGFDDPPGFSLFTPRNPECRSSQARLAGQLVCDFRTSFELRIRLLRASHDLGLQQTPGSPARQQESSGKDYSDTSAAGKKPLPPKKRDLARYFVGLTEKQQEAASLRLEYGISESEIARRLGISRKSVSDRLAAARTRMDSEQNREKLKGKRPE